MSGSGCKQLGFPPCPATLLDAGYKDCVYLLRPLKAQSYVAALTPYWIMTLLLRLPIAILDVILLTIIQDYDVTQSFRIRKNYR